MLLDLSRHVADQHNARRADERVSALQHQLSTPRGFDQVRAAAPKRPRNLSQPNMGNIGDLQDRGTDSETLSERQVRPGLEWNSVAEARRSAESMMTIPASRARLSDASLPRVSSGTRSTRSQGGSPLPPVESKRTDHLKRPPSTTDGDNVMWLIEGFSGQTGGPH